MNIGKIANGVAEGIKNAYVKKGAKVATSIENLANKKIENNAKPMELWHNARAASVKWQTKQSHKELLNRINSTIENFALEHKHPNYSAENRYDDFIYIGSKCFEPFEFINCADSLGDKSLEFADDIKKLYDELNGVRITGCVVKYGGDTPICKTLNHILKMQKAKLGY